MSFPSIPLHKDVETEVCSECGGSGVENGCIGEGLCSICLGERVIVKSKLRDECILVVDKGLYDL